MADDEPKPSQTPVEPGFAPVSVRGMPGSSSPAQFQSGPESPEPNLPETGLSASRENDFAYSAGPPAGQTESPKPRTGFAAFAATALFGGILGGILGFGGTVVQHRFEGSKLKDVLTGQISALTARVDAIHSKDATASAAARAAVTSLETRVAGIENAVHKAAEAAEEAQSGQADLESRVAGAESTANKAAESAASAQDGLQKALAALPPAQDLAAAAADHAALAALETRVAAAESTANKAAESAASAEAGLQKITESQAAQDPASAGPNHATLAALETRVSAAESTANKAAESAASAEASLQKALESQPTALGSAAGSSSSGGADLGPLNARIGAIEHKLSSLESTFAAAPKANFQPPTQQTHPGSAVTQDDPAQAIAIVAQSLLHKLESGEQFPGELMALENLGVPADSLAPLRAVSTSADSTERELTAQFAALAPAIIKSDPANQASGDENFFDRLARRAKSLVHIHRLGGPEATDVDSLVTRIESALADHDLEAAYKLWTQLPGVATAKSEGWGGTVKARLDAISAARSIESDAVAVLGKSKS